MTPQPPLFNAQAAIAVLARNAAPVRFARWQSEPAANRATAVPGVSTFLELLTVDRGTGTVPTETERL